MAGGYVMKERMSWLFNTYIAHRGYHVGKEIPENSIKSFENAIKEGFAIELDLRLSKDNQVVVFHDGNLKRMTGINKQVQDCTYNELKQYSLYETTETIPHFHTVLEVVNGKVPLMVELKTENKVGELEEKAYALLKNYRGEFVVQSFHPFSLGWFKKNAPHIVRGQLSGSFRGEKLTPIRKKILSRLLLNFVSEPHFINYELKYLHKLPKVYREGKKIPLIGWTARTEEQFINGLKQCRNVVFEGFNPKYIN